MKSPYGECFCLKSPGLEASMPSLLLCHHSDSDDLAQAQQNLQIAFIETCGEEDHNQILTDYFGRSNRDNIKSYVENLIGQEAYNSLNPTEQKIALPRYMVIETLAREIMRLQIILRSYTEAWEAFPEGEYQPEGPE